VNTRFLEVQEAWRVLNDANEKAWYDEHRDDILRAGRAADSDDDDPENKMPNLWPYFSASCFSGFSASHADNFYSTYQRVFEEIWNCEPAERRAQGFPVLGTVMSPWKVRELLVVGIVLFDH
jgi:DnaJ homolog subfamily A member 5